MYIKRTEIDCQTDPLIWEGDADYVYKAIYHFEDTSKIPMLWSIDPYGDTFITERQVPLYIAELELIKQALEDSDLVMNIESLEKFLSGIQSHHVARIVGD